MAVRILWGICGIVAIAAALCAFAGVVLCEAALRPPRRPVPANASAVTVQVTARDGIALRAWLWKPDKPNGDAILILHGIADSRASQVGLARISVNLIIVSRSRSGRFC
jgi:hypothetical protein